MIWVSGVNEFERPDGIGKVSNSLLANDFLPLPPFEGMAGIVRV